MSLFDRQTWTTGLVRARDAFLDALTAIQPGQVLNPGGPAHLPPAGDKLAAEVKRALDEIKIAAISPDGSGVDYSWVRNSSIYAEYRRACSPRLRTFEVAQLDTHPKRLAFWINLYNTLILDAVIAFNIQRSVSEDWLGSLSFFRRSAYNVAGLRVSCDDIEHGILRANRGHPFLPGRQFAPGDPRQEWVISPPDVRIHFALNCASRSCPPIQVYTPEGLEAQLDMATRNFVNQDVIINPNSAEIRLSPIFGWFRADFGGRAGVIDFIRCHLLASDLSNWLGENAARARLHFKPYDWRLNAYLPTG